MAKKMKPKIMKVIRTDAFVKITQETDRTFETKTVPVEPGRTEKKEVTNVREITETAHEAPLPSFDKALQALAPIACRALEIPSDWAKGVTVNGLAVSYDKNGRRTVTLFFAKSLDRTATTHPLKTPAFLIDDGKTTSEGRRQCTPTESDRVIEFIKEAQDYALGERSQTLLKFEEETKKEDDKTAPLPGLDGPAIGE